MRVSSFGALVVLIATTLPVVAQTTGPNATGARPGNEIGTGSSLPMSNKSSNINANDSRAVAPNLPTPAIGEEAAVRDYLVAARNSLAAGKTGVAQQSLEMAQTRLLDRSVRPSQINEPSRDPRVQRIEEARQALGNKNIPLAMQIIDSTLAR